MELSLSGFSRGTGPTGGVCASVCACACVGVWVCVDVCMCVWIDKRIYYEELSPVIKEAGK